MIRLLTALPNTELSRRLKREGRLFVDYELSSTDDGDHCSQGLNFTTLRPRGAVFEDARLDRPDATSAGYAALRARSIAPGIAPRSPCAETSMKSVDSAGAAWQRMPR